MWWPRTFSELQSAFDEDQLGERPWLELKREVTREGIDIAEDVAAMSTQGGVLIYGVEETESRATDLRAIPNVEKERQRIANCVRDLVQGTVVIDSFPLFEEPGDTDGYLVVVVPKSANAPHGVFNSRKKTTRYLGRDSVGNRPLTPAEVDDLYRRRALWEDERDRELGDAVDRSRMWINRGSGGYAVIVRPRLPDTGLLGRAMGSGSRSDAFTYFREKLLQSAGAADQARDGVSTWSLLAGLSEWVPGPAYGWRTPEPLHDNGVVMEISGTGTVIVRGYRWRTRLADGTGRSYVCESALVADMLQTLWAAGAIYADADYSGEVDMTVLLSKVRDAISGQLYEPGAAFNHKRLSAAPAYFDEEYRWDARCTQRALTEQTHALAYDLLHPFLRVIWGTEDHDALPKPPRN